MNDQLGWYFLPILGPIQSFSLHVYYHICVQCSRMTIIDQKIMFWFNSIEGKGHNCFASYKITFGDFLTPCIPKMRSSAQNFQTPGGFLQFFLQRHKRCLLSWHFGFLVTPPWLSWQVDSLQASNQLNQLPKSPWKYFCFDSEMFPSSETIGVSWAFSCHDFGCIDDRWTVCDHWS